MANDIERLNDYEYRQRQAKERALRHSQMLPADLAEQILQACEIERAQTIEHIDEIKAKIAEFEARKKEIHEAAKKFQSVLQLPDLVRTDSRGNKRTVKQRPLMVKTKEQVEAERPALELQRRINNLTTDVYRWESHLGSINAVERAARTGRVNVILHLASEWRNTTVMGGIRRLMPKPNPEPELLCEGGESAKQTG